MDNLEVDLFDEQKLKLMLIECQSFYSIFKSIDEKYISKQHENIMNDVFDEDVIRNSFTFLFPYVVNGAFAAELALKYIYANSRVDYPKGSNGHRLKYLYDNLMKIKKSCIKKDQEALRNILFNDGNQNEETISLNLEIIDCCFNDFRYFFSSNKNIAINNFFPFFVNSLCEYVLDKGKSLLDECFE